MSNEKEGDAQLEETRDRIEAPLERERLYAFVGKYVRKYEYVFLVQFSRTD